MAYHTKGGQRESKLALLGTPSELHAESTPLHQIVCDDGMVMEEETRRGFPGG